MKRWEIIEFIKELILLIIIALILWCVISTGNFSLSRFITIFNIIH